MSLCKRPSCRSLTVCPVQGDGARTSITLDFGDGHALTYSNVSSIEDGIKHIYKAVGIYRVTATGENSLGSEAATLYLHVTCEFPCVCPLHRSFFSLFTLTFSSSHFFISLWSCCSVHALSALPQPDKQVR